MQSPEFASRWARRRVRTCTSGVKHFRHPVVGAMELAFENLHTPGNSGQRMIAYSAESRTPSEAARRLLASCTAAEANEPEHAAGSTSEDIIPS
jgi:hypothetical protein